MYYISTMRRNRPSRHLRRYKSGKRRLINPHIKKKFYNFSSAVFTPTPEEFVELREKKRQEMPEHKRDSLSKQTPEELRKKNIKLILTEEKDAGGGITPEGEIINIFSLKKGKGKEIMEKLIEKPGKYKLDCFDKENCEEKGLPDYYKKYGFKETRREKNIKNGGPDVVYMEMEK